MLLILVSSSTYSQRIRTIGTDTFVTFSREQAKAINDTFVSQKQTINKMKVLDSLNIISVKYLIQQDSIRKAKDSITYYQQVLPVLTEIKQLLVAQVETPFKGNIEMGVGAGASTYFGAYRPFSTVIDGQYYIPSGVGVLKYNFQKHLTLRFEAAGTKVTAGPISEQIIMGTVLADYNIAPNMYSVRVGMIPTVSVGYTVFGLPSKSPTVGAGIKKYFTSNTALEINVRYQLTDLDKTGAMNHLMWGHLTITRKIK